MITPKTYYPVLCMAAGSDAVSGLCLSLSDPINSRVRYVCRCYLLNSQGAMRTKTRHVVRAPNGWSVTKEGAKRASRTFKTQEEAISYGRKISKKQGGELYIHGRDGMIRSKQSYKDASE